MQRKNNSIKCHAILRHYLSPTGQRARGKREDAREEVVYQQTKSRRELRVSCFELSFYALLFLYSLPTDPQYCLEFIKIWQARELTADLKNLECNRVALG